MSSEFASRVRDCAWFRASSGGRGSMGVGGRTTLSTVYFRKLPLARVREFQFQVRPYEWAEFKDIVLWPKESRAESE